MQRVWNLPLNRTSSASARRYANYEVVRNVSFNTCFYRDSDMLNGCGAVYHCRVEVMAPGHDPNAVRLWTDDDMDIGYLPRAIASSMAFHLRRGRRYVGKVAAVLGEDHQVDHRAVLLVEKVEE